MRTTQQLISDCGYRKTTQTLKKSSSTQFTSAETHLAEILTPSYAKTTPRRLISKTTSLQTSVLVALANITQLQLKTLPIGPGTLPTLTTISQPLQAQPHYGAAQIAISTHGLITLAKTTFISAQTPNHYLSILQ